jgi:hypothetical protein
MVAFLLANCGGESAGELRAFDSRPCFVQGACHAGERSWRISRRPCSSERIWFPNRGNTFFRGSGTGRRILTLIVFFRENFSKREDLAGELRQDEAGRRGKS